jgi:tetratricopeptide (TPR) repeat protein
LAVALSHLGDRSLAAAAFEKAHKLAQQKIQRQRAEIANAKALNLWQAGDMDGALAAFNQALSDDPEFAEAHYNLGRLLWKLGKANEAAAQYKSALAYRPGYPEALNELGEVYLALGQTDQAGQLFRTAVMTRFAFAPAHLSLGRALNKQGRRDEAEEQFQETILLAPQNAAAHIELGLAFAQTDGALSPRARSELAEGLRLDPSLRGLIPEQMAGRLP